MNMAHIAWCQGEHTVAIRYYRKSIEIPGSNWDLFLASFNEDKPYLITNGIAKDEIPLLLDALLSEVIGK